MLLAFVKDFPTAVAAVLIMGIGYSISGPLSTKMVAINFKNKERATAIGFKQRGTSSGSTLAALTLPSIAVVAQSSSAFIAVIAAAAMPFILVNYVRANNHGRAEGESYMLRAVFE
ncbi:MAG: hypothetical protein QXQ48_06760 [Nitrososphaerota archaeon]